METLCYAMSISLDGYIADPTGSIAFSEPIRRCTASPTSRPVDGGVPVRLRSL
jgi:hypothetical protein